MAFEGLRSKLRSLAGSSSETVQEVSEETPARVRRVGKTAGGAVARRAPSTDLERNKKPSAREEIANRLKSSGEMRKPIEDANLEPGNDPREIEAFARGDSTVGPYFGEGEGTQDANEQFFGGHEETVGTQGMFVQELLDERDHEGGHYAYEDEREEGWLDDGIPMGDIMAESPDDGDMRWF